MLIEKLKRYVKKAENTEQLYISLIRIEALSIQADINDIGNTAYNSAIEDVCGIIKNKLKELLDLNDGDEDE